METNNKSAKRMEAITYEEPVWVGGRVEQVIQIFIDNSYKNS